MLFLAQGLIYLFYFVLFILFTDFRERKSKGRKRGDRERYI